MYSADEQFSWMSVVYGVVTATGVGTFVAVASDGSQRVMTSTNGSTWFARRCGRKQLLGFGDLRLVDGVGTFVAVAGDGTHQVMTSTDGVT